MSNKSVAEKLLIKANTAVWASPRSNLALVEPLPKGVRLVTKPEKSTTAPVFAEDSDSHEVWSALRFRPIRKDEAPFTGGR